MDDGEALIRAIRADRDADTPRLVYADWLDDHGDRDRAEFVRLQCWLAANPESHPEWEASWRREQELLRGHVGRWAAELGGYYEGVEFDRGFPTTFSIGDVQEFTWVVGELARMTATDRLRVGRVGDEDVGVLGRCEDMTAVAELETNADASGLSLDGLDRLVRSPHLQQLRRLDLSGAYFADGNPDAELLARLPVLPELEHLHLGQSYPSAGGLAVVLLTSPHRRRLRGLELNLSSFADMAEFCACPEVARLTHLHINGASGFTADALVGCPYLDGIRLLAIEQYEDDEPLAEATWDRLRERFGDRVVLDPAVHVGGPERTAYRRRVVTGRRR